MRLSYDRLCAAIAGEPLPLAVIDLDALERNVDGLVARARGKPLRIATKSVRCPELLRRIGERGGARIQGLMAYCAEEALFLAESGFEDIVVAYPPGQRSAFDVIAAANRKGARVAVAVDGVRHLELASAAAVDLGVEIPIVVDVDVSYRPIGARVHLGARRSPLHAPDDVASFVGSIARYTRLVFKGLLAYEAHVAGLPDDAPGALFMNRAKVGFKGVAMKAVRDQRRAIALELERRGQRIVWFNGGGTGSLDASADDPALTEVAVGSGFLASHLFDRYADLDLSPAAFFALAVTRIPAPGFVTCHSGGFVASGSAGEDRLPLPVLPEGLELRSAEGAGEVQTPLCVPRGVELSIGSPVFFRHAKAGELAEHFSSYLLVRGGTIEGRAPTYRGLSRCFH